MGLAETCCQVLISRSHGLGLVEDHRRIVVDIANHGLPILVVMYLGELLEALVQGRGVLLVFGCDALHLVGDAVLGLGTGSGLSRVHGGFTESNVLA